MILRTIKCDVCGETATEKKPNEGWQGWGAIQGVSRNGADNPNLCPYHLAEIMDWLDDNYPIKED
jgi:hypothetical protein